MTLLLATLLCSALAMDARTDVEAVLDDLHLAAAQAAGERYFDHYSPDAVFLGTDAGERWTVDEFRAYAAPIFSSGRGWTYVASERHVTLSADGRVAWFDERLQNEKYGEVRGSGVLELAGEGEERRWRVAQYNLALPVPNELAPGLTERVVAQERVGEPRGDEVFVRDGERTLVLWNKVVPRLVAPDAEGPPPPIVVLLPSASFSARATWDFPLRDYSVMNALARRGFDVFAVELGGYGLSSPPEDDPAGGCASAQRDLGLALDRIAELRGERPVFLVGPSWGSQVAGAYAAAHPERVRGLVLYGFRWKTELPRELVLAAFGEGVLAAPRRPVTREAARADFQYGLYEGDVPEAFADHLLRQGRTVPTGALRDYVERLPLVDPGELSVPTLMLYGRGEFGEPSPLRSDGGLLFQEHRDEQRAFHAALAGPRHWVELPGAGHSAHLDAPHVLFQRCLAGWLERQP